jgi:hypothetical protein
LDTFDGWIGTVQASLAVLASAAGEKVSAAMTRAGIDSSKSKGTSDQSPSGHSKSDGVAFNGVNTVINRWSQVGMPTEESTMSGRSSKPVRAQRSIDFSDRGLGNNNEDNDDDNDEDDDDVDSISSSDSDIQELSAPLVPDWATWQNLRTSVARFVSSGQFPWQASGTKSKAKSKSSKGKREVAGLGLLSARQLALSRLPLIGTPAVQQVMAQGYRAASWVAEWSAYGVVIVSAAVWSVGSSLRGWATPDLPGEENSTSRTRGVVKMILAPRPPSGPPKKKFVLRPSQPLEEQQSIKV